MPPAASVSKAADLIGLAEGVRVTLSVNCTCPASTLIRAQINWLRMDGSMIRVDATRSVCDATQGTASVSALRPQGARAAYFYFANDGNANAQLSEERASAVGMP